MPTREELELRGQEELKRYGGKPSYESTMGEVPQYLRGEQDYRYHPEKGRYMIYDKKRGQFLVDASAPISTEDDFEMERAAPAPSMPVDRAAPVPSLPVDRAFPADYDEAEMKYTMGERYTDADMANMRSMPVKKAMPLRPQNVKKTVEDLRGATEFLKVLSNREKMNKKTKR